jgi:hypothetical protein
LAFSPVCMCTTEQTVAVRPQLEAVLECVEKYGLVENARITGAFLQAGLHELAVRPPHPTLGFLVYRPLEWGCSSLGVSRAAAADLFYPGATVTCRAISPRARLGALPWRPAHD